MIEDDAERTRAILWMLADASPGMTLVAALGHLKAIELRITEMVAESANSEAPPYAGSAGVAKLVKEASADPVTRGMAQRGERTALMARLHAETNCTVLTAAEAATTLLNIHEKSELPF